MSILPMLMPIPSILPIYCTYSAYALILPIYKLDWIMNRSKCGEVVLTQSLVFYTTVNSIELCVLQAVTKEMRCVKYRCLMGTIVGPITIVEQAPVTPTRPFLQSTALHVNWTVNRATLHVVSHDSRLLILTSAKFIRQLGGHSGFQACCRLLGHTMLNSDRVNQSLGDFNSLILHWSSQLVNRCF